MKINGVNCYFSSFLCPKGYLAITIFNLVFFRKSYEEMKMFHNLDVTVNHEKIHIMQGRKEWWVLFYIKYAFYYIKNKCKGMEHMQAYLNIPYEIEAYNNENNMNYTIKKGGE